MRVLIFTQKLDKSDRGVLGFFHGWVAEFAKHFESIIVIALSTGEYSLPNNVKILSLGKNTFVIRHSSFVILKKLKYTFNFFKYIWRERKNYDAVFVHMNQIYVLLGGLFWHLWQKPIGFWYAHGKVGWSLRLAAKLANIIFTSTSSGFRVKTLKVKIVGQGIDTEVFKPDFSKRDNQAFKIITVGRLSPVKNYETLILAAEILAKNRLNFKVEIIGETATEEDKKYQTEMKLLIRQKGLSDKITFLGGMANQEIVDYLQRADLFVNMSQTGSLDKAMLEAMACGLPVISSNEAVIHDVLAQYKDLLSFRKNNHMDLAKKIIRIMVMSKIDCESLGRELRKIVVTDHNIESLIKKIVNAYL